MIEIGTVNERKVFYQKYGTDIPWSKDFPSENWLLFAIVTNKKKTELFEISRRLIENNACYVCCAGEQRELLHDIIDDDIVLRAVGIENNYLPPFDIMTTGHSDVENGFWFSIYTAYNDPMVIDAVVCLDGSGNDLEYELSNLFERFKQGYLPPDE